MIGNSLQAYRVTGDTQLLDGLRQRIDYLYEVRLDPQWGVEDPTSEAVFQNGFVARVLLDAHRDLADADPQRATRALLLCWGLVDWNLNVARWSYYMDSTVEDPTRHSNGTSMTMIGPAVSFYRLTGRRDVLEDAIGFVEEGYNGGAKPYGAFPVWDGGWEGRAYEYAVLHPKADETPPATVADLVARDEGGDVRLEWTAPADAMHYLVVWSELPISRTFTKAPDERNFWAGHIVSQALHARPGETESLTVPGLPVGQTLHFAVIARDAAGNCGAVSNVPALAR